MDSNEISPLEAFTFIDERHASYGYTLGKLIEKGRNTLINKGRDTLGLTVRNEHRGSRLMTNCLT